MRADHSPDLPSELINEVLNSCSVNELASLAVTTKSLNLLAEPRLYHSIQHSSFNERSLIGCMETLTSSRKGSMVYCLAITIFPNRTEEGEDRFLTSLRAVRQALLKMVSLEFLSLRWRWSFEPPAVRLERRCVEDVIWSASKSDPPELHY